MRGYGVPIVGVKKCVSSVQSKASESILRAVENALKVRPIDDRDNNAQLLAGAVDDYWRTKSKFIKAFRPRIFRRSFVKIVNVCQLRLLERLPVQRPRRSPHGAAPHHLFEPIGRDVGEDGL